MGDTSSVVGVIPHFHHTKAGSVVGLVSHADVCAQVPGVKPGFEMSMQHNGRLAAEKIGNFTALPTHGHAHAQTDGFAERFFGTEPSGQVARAAFQTAITARFPHCPLSITQNFVCKSIAVASQTVLDAANVAYISAYAVNHSDSSNVLSFWVRFTVTWN